MSGAGARERHTSAVSHTMGSSLYDYHDGGLHSPRMSATPPLSLVLLTLQLPAMVAGAEADVEDASAKGPCALGFYVGSPQRLPALLLESLRASCQTLLDRVSGLGFIGCGCTPAAPAAPRPPSLLPCLTCALAGPYSRTAPRRLVAAPGRPRGLRAPRPSGSRPGHAEPSRAGRVRRGARFWGGVAFQRRSGGRRSEGPCEPGISRGAHGVHAPPGSAQHTEWPLRDVGTHALRQAVDRPSG
jgi:hypothetical protein